MPLPIYLRSLRIYFAPALALLFLSASAQLPPDDQDAHTRVGDKMPAISVEQSSGATFKLSDQSGKVILVDFWATWCGPCRAEMPHLEKEIWQKYKSQDFAMIAIGREETKKSVTQFQKQFPAFTYPMAWDPRRSTYAFFANAGIPRNYVVNRHGVIVYQSLGYAPEDIAALDRAIQKALASK